MSGAAWAVYVFQIAATLAAGIYISMAVVGNWGH